MSLLLIGCQKSELLIPQNQEEKDSNALESYRIMTASYRGVYVDNYMYFCGDTIKENQFLDWCKRYNFNAISVYDLNNVLIDHSKYTPLSNFIKRAKTKYGILEVAAVREKGTQFTGSTATYNKNMTDIDKKFNVFNLENEYWNGMSTWTTYSSYLSTLKNLTYIPKPKTEAYIGWFTPGQEVKQSNKFVLCLDRILVHDYETSPNISYIQSRLQYLANSAKSQNKVMDVIILFSCESVFMGNYYKTHTFDDSFQDIISQYQNSSITNKGNLNIIGYQIFTQSLMRKIKA